MRERPAGEREKKFARASGEDQFLADQIVRLALKPHAKPLAAPHFEDRGLRQKLAPGNAHARGPAIRLLTPDLPARARIVVEQSHTRTGFAGGNRRGQPRGARAHDENIESQLTFSAMVLACRNWSR